MNVTRFIEEFKQRDVLLTDDERNDIFQMIFESVDPTEHTIVTMEELAELNLAVSKKHWYNLHAD